ncbi:porin family protein [Thiohalophilus sp.]|uniref:porin family protein n=1 Tax=Thiohalophilus sp. TaxID=3028392 RepID=UPI002ACDB316|nr:porin family protein [Thiohalophilus sp.]MDZ7660750.1 porin family protein [Thiohalophilus sp.]
MKKLISFLALALFANLALAAETEQYLGLDYSWGKYETSNGSIYDLDGVRVRYGKYLVPHFALEAHFLYGTSGDNLIHGTDAGGKLHNKHTTSLFLRGDIGDTYKLYALLGWSHSTFEVSGLGIQPKERESDMSYGAGIEYLVSQRTAIDINYMMYHDEDYLEFTVTSFGITQRF